MIISQTPYRVSFAGGGTDLPAFYRRQYGAVLSMAIDRSKGLRGVRSSFRFSANVKERSGSGSDRAG